MMEGATFYPESEVVCTVLQRWGVVVSGGGGSPISSS